MDYSSLSGNGLKASKVSLGLMTIENNKNFLNLYLNAIDNGINFLDTADTYQNANGDFFLSKILSSVSREKIIISTKVYFPRTDNILNSGLNRKNIIHSVNNSLKRMNTEYIDFLICHRYDNSVDELILQETIDILIKSGKILHWGVSNFTSYQITKFLYNSSSIERPTLIQNPYNLFNRSVEKDIFEICSNEKISLQTYYPLSQGVLTGKYLNKPYINSRANNNDLKSRMWDLKTENEIKINNYLSLCMELNIKPSQLAILWCLKNDIVSTVLTSVSNQKQLNELISTFNYSFSSNIFEEVESIFN